MKFLAASLLVSMLSGGLCAQSSDFFDLVQTGKPEEVQAAIARGADVRAKGDNEATPLHFAAQANKNPEVIRLLVKAGADVDALDGNGCTPLLDVLSNTEKRPAIALELVHAGANANAVDRNGYTPLGLALGKKYPADFVLELLKAGAKAKSGIKEPPLVSATANKYPVSVIKALLKADADPNQANPNGITPLQSAAMNNAAPEIVGALLQAGADPKTKTRTRRTR